MWSELYYGNTIKDWAIALSIIFGSLIFGKLVYWFLKNIIGFFTKKTKNRLDDIILDMIEEPVAFVIVLTGILFGVKTLSFSAEAILKVEYIFKFLFTLSASWFLSRLYDALHQEYIAPLAAKTETDLDDNLLPVIRKIVKLIIWSLGIIVALNNIGYDVSTVVAGLGIGGIAFALAVQHTFGNLIGGLNIFVDNHFKVGSRIQMKGSIGLIDGVVQEIGLRTTIIKTRYEGRLMLIPNSKIVTSEVINVDSEDGRQVFTVYKLAPQTTASKVELVMQELKLIVENNPDTKKDLIVSGLIQVTEISTDVMLLYWIKPEASNLKTRTAVNLEIIRLFEKLEVKLTEKSAYRYDKDAIF